jgi:metal-responsive CopG/Arc/MetJ family transcriptional regulator
MRTTVTVEYELLNELLKKTKARSKASAVKEAVREYLRREKIKEIRAAKGMLEFDRTAEDIRHHER